MDRILNWIIKNKSKSFFIILIIFFVPLITVHFLFKLTAVSSFFVAEWTAGELLGFISGFLAFIGTVVLGGLALWQNQQIHNQQVEMLEPNLSMNLVSQNGLLFITVENTGQTAAKDIELELIKIENNGEDNSLQPDELFMSKFQLYPNEKLQGFIGINGENIGTHTFPKVTLKVKYVRFDINRANEYTRTITYNNGFAEKIIADVNVDNRKFEDDIESIAYSIVRATNYLEGGTLFKTDKLNVFPKSSLAKDMLNAVQALKSTNISNNEHCNNDCAENLNTTEEHPNDK